MEAVLSTTPQNPSSRIQNSAELEYLRNTDGRQTFGDL